MAQNKKSIDQTSRDWKGNHNYSGSFEISNTDVKLTDLVDDATNTTSITIDSDGTLRKTTIVDIKYGEVITESDWVSAITSVPGYTEVELTITHNLGRRVSSVIIDDGVGSITTYVPNHIEDNVIMINSLGSSTTDASVEGTLTIV